MSIGLRPFVGLSERIEIGLPIRTGNGVVQFRYERPHRDEVPWDEEILDREQISVYSAGVDVQFRVAEKWNLTGEAGGRTSSPMRTVVDFDREAFAGRYVNLGASYDLNPR